MRKYIADLQPVLDSPEILENADAADYDVVFVPAWARTDGGSCGVGILR